MESLNETTGQEKPTEGEASEVDVLVSREHILLKAAYDILKKCNQAPIVLDVLGETAFYDGTDCDGYCLAADIAYLLDLEELN
ncbi:MAG: hypothetical protein GY943_31050 [Chloroflexi bacterium]|nr:hypothetical protein [Chloroflexota bacterium]